MEEKIKAFNSQLIHSGQQPEYERALTHQKKMIEEYEKKIKNLESEKKMSDDVYSSELFEKQNLILMSLAAKLNERDEVNMHLNEELCAYDRITKETEEQLEKKTRRI